MYMCNRGNHLFGVNVQDQTVVTTQLTESCDFQLNRLGCNSYPGDSHIAIMTFYFILLFFFFQTMFSRQFDRDVLQKGKYKFTL